MSNIFTRTKYDETELRRFDTTNTKSYQHITNLDYNENKNNCVNPNVPSQNAGLSRPLNQEGFLNFNNKVDIENKLRNQHVELNSDRRNNVDYTEVETNNIEMCSIKENNVYQESDLSMPVKRELSYTDRVIFDPVYYDRQTIYAEDNKFNTPVDRMGVSTRYENKNGQYTNTLKAYKTAANVRAAENSMNNFNMSVAALLPRKN